MYKTITKAVGATTGLVLGTAASSENDVEVIDETDESSAQTIAAAFGLVFAMLFVQ